MNKEQMLSVFDQVARKYLGRKGDKFSWDEAKLIQDAINYASSLIELEVDPKMQKAKDLPNKPKK